jgi:hypothetical protein
LWGLPPSDLTQGASLRALLRCWALGLELVQAVVPPVTENLAGQVAGASSITWVNKA